MQSTPLRRRPIRHPVELAAASMAHQVGTVVAWRRATQLLPSSRVVPPPPSRISSRLGIAITARNKACSQMALTVSFPDPAVFRRAPALPPIASVKYHLGTIFVHIPKTAGTSVH